MDSKSDNKNNNNRTRSASPKKSSSSSNNNNNSSSTDSSKSLMIHQPSYCGQKLTLKCEILSPVCRQYTIEPETPVYKFAGGLVGWLDLLVIVFALGSQLPSLLQQQQSATTVAAVETTVRTPPLPILIGIGFLAARFLYHLLFARVPAERLTVIRGVGCQLNRKQPGIFSSWSSTELIDVATMTNLVIHEGFLRHRVVYFMAIACQDRPSLILPFNNTLPQLAVLRVILRGVRAVLYGETEEGLSLAEMEQAATNSNNNNNNTSMRNAIIEDDDDDDDAGTTASNSQVSKSDDDDE